MPGNVPEHGRVVVQTMHNRARECVQRGESCGGQTLGGVKFRKRQLYCYLIDCTSNCVIDISYTLVTLYSC